MTIEPTVFVVDDDDAVRKSLCWLIESVGLKVEAFASADAFLDSYQPAMSGCLVLDVRMPGMSGLDLQQLMERRQIELPIIFVSGHGDIPMAVRTLKAGAIDFIEKPFNDQMILDAIQKAIDSDRKTRQKRQERSGIESLLQRLTPREHEVMALVVDGKSNKAIAAALEVSVKTVEHHRAMVMEKMQADSLSALVRLALLAEQYEGKP